MLFRKKKVSASREQILVQVESLAEVSDNNVMIAYNTLSFPITNATNGYDFQGGFASGKPLQLIEKAILKRGNKLAQVMPLISSDFIIDKLPQQDNVVFYAGILLNNFGHFLLESLSRLWAYHLFENLNLPILFYAPWGTSDYLKKDNYINQTLKGFGIPAERIIFCNEITWFKAVIIPEQKYGFTICRNPDHRFLNFIGSFDIPLNIKPTLPTAERIYVSRSGLPFKQGRPIAETLFENFLQANKYIIIHPETLTLFQQLILYKNARQIIFCDGGATYATILLPKLKADIAIVARRRDYRGNYKDITEHFAGYKKTVLWIDEVVWQYQFGAETWDALAEVDWHKVSLALKEDGFVESVFETGDEKKWEEVRKKDLMQFIDSIRMDSRFINYMALQKEQYPILPSTL